MNYDNDALAHGAADQDEPLLPDRMLRIRNRDRQWVCERGARFVKGDPMLSEVRRRLAGIPQETQSHRENLRRDWGTCMHETTMMLPPLCGNPDPQCQGAADAKQRVVLKVADCPADPCTTDRRDFVHHDLRQRSQAVPRRRLHGKTE